MLVHPWDDARSDQEWRQFVQTKRFGHLVAGGRDRQVPVVVPTQFLLEADHVLLHLARPNPVWRAVEERPTVLLVVTDDWAYVPSAWKAVGDEDPAAGIPTTYYASVQLTCSAAVVDDEEEKLAILRAQLADLQPELPVDDPATHRELLRGIRGLRLTVHDVRAKFKYGGNVDAEHRMAVAERLAARGRPADLAARRHLLRRLDTGRG